MVDEYGSKKRVVYKYKIKGIHVRLTEIENEQLLELAKLMQKNRSSVICYLINKEYEQEVKNQ